MFFSCVGRLYLANITIKQVIYYYGGRWVIHYADTFTCALDRL